MTNNKTNSRPVLPTYFISHGGGPWPWLKEQMPGVYDKLEAALKDMPRQLGVTPKAVLMVSGHWEERDFTVMSIPAPSMVYDYSGFPEFTYHPVPGARLARSCGTRPGVAPRRGFRRPRVGSGIK